MRTKLRWFCLAMLFIAGCSETPSAEILGRFDQAATVGTEVLVELRATFATDRALSFAFDSDSIGIRQRGELLPLGATSAVFRWMPYSEDVGTWRVDVHASDGVTQTTETLTIRVGATNDGTPVFRRPLGVGSVLDLEQDDCLRLDVIVDDADTADVTIEMEEPVLPNSTLTGTGRGEARWEYCPHKPEVDAVTHRLFTLSASDGTHEKVVKQFRVVLKPAREFERINLGGWVLFEQKSSCAFLFPGALKVPRGGVIVIGRNAPENTFRTYWDEISGKKFADNASYWDSRGRCFKLSGEKEQYFLFDNTGQQSDGPTLEVAEGSNLQRIRPTQNASELSSWSLGAPASANAGRRPAGVTLHRPYVSEVGDVAQGESVDFQFIEITIE